VLPLPDGGGGDVDASNTEPTNFFSDTFDRPNGAVANGWREKTANTFTITDQRAHPTTGGDWTQLVLYRPPEEDLLDVEVVSEITWSSTNPSVNCDATLAARIDSSTVASSAGITGYIAFIDDTRGMTLSRVDSGAEAPFSGTELPTPVNTTDTYRMTLRVTGTNPVVLTAIFEKKDGTAWSLVKSHSANDDGNRRITKAGSVGITSDTNGTFRYDNFTRKKL